MSNTTIQTLSKEPNNTRKTENYNVTYHTIVRNEHSTYPKITSKETYIKNKNEKNTIFVF
jgi:hypothetical protein